jgi:beta-N-acetylhexosaminidase
MSKLMISIAGTTLVEGEAALLQHENIHSVILFTRNFESIEQLKALTQAIKSVNPKLKIAADHEGGRVQRFKEGFTILPPAESYGLLYDGNLDGAIALAEKYKCTSFKAAAESTLAEHKAEYNGDAKQLYQQAALKLCRDFGKIMASELKDCGVDFSLAPVLDLKGPNEVIGELQRAFHKIPECAALLAGSFCAGMHDAGMPSTAKHFPGHGSCTADSHFSRTVDERPSSEILKDLSVFQKCIETGSVDMIMPAHVAYPNFKYPDYTAKNQAEADSATKIAGYSPYWLEGVLRKKLNFSGVIISDCITMAGADIGDSSYVAAADIGDDFYVPRAHQAAAAGCDLIIFNAHLDAEIIKNPQAKIQAVANALNKNMLQADIDQSNQRLASINFSFPTTVASKTQSKIAMRSTL